eukprot:332882-Lingulodinium_polyedra.AAC.1
MPSKAPMAQANTCGIRVTLLLIDSSKLLSHPDIFSTQSVMSHAGNPLLALEPINNLMERLS